MGSFCFDRFLEPDTVVPAGQLSRGGGPTSKDSVVWYHRNEDPMAAHGTPSYYENVMRTQGLDPSAFPDPLLHRTFGGAMSGGGFARKDDTTLVAKQVSGAGGAVLEVVLATVEACADEATWLAAVAAAVATEAARGTVAQKEAEHRQTWAALWARSYLDISPNSHATNHNDGGGAEQAGGATKPPGAVAASSQLLLDPLSVEAVNQAYVWQRFLDLADGRDTWGVIKFNGQGCVNTSAAARASALLTGLANEPACRVPAGVRACVLACLPPLTAAAATLARSVHRLREWHLWRPRPQDRRRLLCRSPGLGPLQLDPEQPPALLRRPRRR